MPSSQPYQISKILSAIIALDPESLLDIGPGFGKYGVLSREYLDLDEKREKYPDFQKRIDCVEVFETYVTPLYEFIYDNAYIGDVFGIADKLDTYDLILMVDVLEHFSKEKGEKLVKKLLEKNKGVLISVPKNIGTQGAEFHNEHERHIGQWNRRELARLGSHIFIDDETSYIVYLGDKDTVKKLKSKLERDKALRQLKRYFYHIPGAKKVYNSFEKRKGGHGHNH